MRRPAARRQAVGISKHRRQLLGMPLDPVTEAETVAQVIEGTRAGRGGTVLPANLAVLRAYAQSPAVRSVMDSAELIVADGMPLVWASRLQGTPLPSRVAGSTMVWSLSDRLADADASVFLLGGDPQVATKAADRLKAASPGFTVAGTADPWFSSDASDEVVAEIVGAVRRARPDVVYLALPFEKQLRLIPMLRQELPQAWLIGLGVTLSFVTGDVARAPLWVQRSGMEWAHRLKQDPRLYRRYLLEGMPFAVKLAASTLRQRMLPMERRLLSPPAPSDPARAPRTASDG